MSQKMKVKCRCGNRFRPSRQTQLKMAVTGAGAAGGAAIGAAWGTTAGIASGGTALAATVPAGIVGGLILGLGAKLGADWALATATCPSCRATFRVT